ncbi:hypothetical protein HZA97_00010 [Candidatus Woesearchaeota archaeon]|nr:hypothetical protein [Candidatus Woesearchaeota archaeon]
MSKTNQVKAIFALLIVSSFLLVLSQLGNSLSGFATVEPEEQKYVYYTDVVVDGVNIGVLSTTPERVDDYLKYSWSVLDEYNFIPKDASSDQIKEAITSPGGTLILQVDEASYVSNPEAAEALKKGIEYTKGLYNYQNLKEQSLGELQTRIFSSKELSSRDQDAIAKVTERLSGFKGDVDFYVKTSSVLERMNDVENAVRSIEREERQQLENEVERLGGTTAEGRVNQKNKGEEGTRGSEGNAGPNKGSSGGSDTGGGGSGGGGSGGGSPGQSGQQEGAQSEGRGGGVSEDQGGRAPGQSENFPGQGGGQDGERGNSDNAPGQNK